MFKEAGNANEKERVIVLFSDGGFTGTQEELAEAVRLMQEENIRLVIIGVGTKDPVMIPEYNAKGQLTGFMQRDGAAVSVPLEEQNLLQLAAQTGAEYIHLDPSSRIDFGWASKLAGTKVEKRGVNVYHYPLGAAMTLLFLGFLRGVARRRRATTV